MSELKVGLGFTGAHRSGKTTLMKEMASRHLIPYVETTTTQVFQSLGMDPKVEYTIKERLYSQWKILEALVDCYDKAVQVNPSFMADRTPLDLATYMIADVKRTTLLDDHETKEGVMRYIHACKELTAKWFDTVVLVQPGIDFVEAPGKAPACPVYLNHYNLLMKGFITEVSDTVNTVIMPKTTLSLADRALFLEPPILRMKTRLSAEQRERDSKWT